MKLAALLTQPVRFNPPALADAARLRATAGRVLARWPDIVAEPPENDRDRLVGEMHRRLVEDDWDDLPTSFVTRAARALFDPVRRARAELAELREFYIEELRVSTRRSFLGTMASVYIGSYEPGASHTRALADALGEARSRLGGRWTKIEQALPSWLDPEHGHEAIAGIMAGMADPWNELKALGLNTPHAPGLMDYAHLAFVEVIRPGLQDRDELKRLFSWLRPERQEPRMSGAAEAITAVLGHWLSADPSADDQRYIAEALTSFYLDPRVSTSGAWAGVPEQHRAVILRWLTKENMLFFLDVVSAVEDSYMWQERRDFWLSLYDEGVIEAAWVAFSADAQSYALRKAARSGSNLLSFGEQTARGSRVNTSLLILKIGNKIVVEGSHDYKIHVFREAWSTSPKLYRPKYNCEVIRRTSGAEARRHIGNWQGWVREKVW